MNFTVTDTNNPELDNSVHSCSNIENSARKTIKLPRVRRARKIRASQLPRYHAVNTLYGYRELVVHAPSEVIAYEDGEEV